MQDLPAGQRPATFKRSRNESSNHPEHAEPPRTGTYQPRDQSAPENSDSITGHDHDYLLRPNINWISSKPTVEPRAPGDSAKVTTDTTSREIAHEIGLIPISAGVSKYVGPSSGFSVAKLVFNQVEKASPGIIQRLENHETQRPTTSRLKFVVEPTDLPNSVDQTLSLSRTYFEHVHGLYPFLHEPSHYQLVREVYHDINRCSPVDKFQVTMVAAISAIVLSKRTPVACSGEGLSKTAMSYTDQIDFQNSVKGVQCLLLISMFTLHSPFLGINPWYLNYQSLAVALDLGLQRDVSASESVNPFEREMRTRMFWVIYTIDRTLATILGRPIGLRDEACDLRVSE